MSTMVRNMAVAALILGGFAVLGTGLVGLTFTGTRDIIAENERQALLANLSELVPPAHYTNDVTADSIQVTEPQLLGSSEPVTVYRAFRGNQPVALFATPIAPDGYGGPIKLLVGVHSDGTLAGVRALTHRETPGLGDAIDTARSDWMLSFSGKSLSRPELEKWAVRRDGGDFDQFTGATITPRAVVKAVRDFLVYFTRHREQLFLARSSTTAPESSP